MERLTHLHVVPCLVEDDETLARERMSAGMTVWLHSGNHPRLNDPYLDLETRAEQIHDFAPHVIAQSPIGPPELGIEWFEEFIAVTGARHFALHTEMLGEPPATLESIRSLAAQVMLLLLAGRRSV